MNLKDTLKIVMRAALNTFYVNLGLTVFVFLDAWGKWSRHIGMCHNFFLQLGGGFHECTFLEHFWETMFWHLLWFLFLTPLAFCIFLIYLIRRQKRANTTLP